MNLTLGFACLIAGGLTVLVAMGAVAALSRHKKAGTGRLELVGAMAVVETALRPEGSVLVCGELWRARAPQQSVTVERGARVRVMGASGHLLEVEPSR
ncbi:MAG TPA: NfeD family protein [Pyrinomonadaceae bacterium]|jgi:membrane-bound serine protease (ClpP class)|nr:NfeD family protein [Pyrinomonadaceae bacterium]